MLRLLLAMAIPLLVGSGSEVNGTTTLIPSFVAGQAGDLIAVVVGGRQSSSAAPSATGFGGNGNVFLSQAVSSGHIFSTILIKEATDGSAGSVTVSIPNGTTTKARAFRFRTNGGAWKNLECASGSDSVSSDDYEPTFSGSGNFDPPDMQANDRYLVASAIDVSGWHTAAFTALSVSGVSFSTGQEHIDGDGVSGLEWHMVVSDHSATSGTNFADAPEYFAFVTENISATGVSVMLRMREEPAEEKSVGDTLNVKVADSARVTARASKSDTLRVVLSDSVDVDQGLVGKTVTDTLPVVVSDSVEISQLTDFITVADTCRVQVVEGIDVAATFAFTINDTLLVTLSDSAVVNVLLVQSQLDDELLVALDDSVVVTEDVEFLEVSDTLLVALVETIEVLVEINRTDLMFLSIDDEVISLEAQLSVADTLLLSVADSVAVEVTFVPGQPMIRRFSKTHGIRPIGRGRSGVSIA